VRYNSFERLKEAIADRYSIGEEIGHGGMAVVYRARDVKHNRDVALKVLRPELASAVEGARFLREIQIDSRLQHPHILSLHDSGRVDEVLYYVMPYVEGESLRDKLDREQQLPIEESLRIIREVASALTYAHSQGVIHRDLKPENILLSSNHAMLADFGIAQAIAEVDSDRLTGTGIAIGTPTYMSPEQASGDGRLDERSDQYSLGCILFEMLAGEPPFTGRTAQAILARHIQERLPSLEVVRQGLPRHLLIAVETALAKSPADRFPSVAEFTEALEEPEPVETTGEHGVRGFLRSPAGRSLGIALGMAIAVSAYVLWPSSPALDSRKIVVFPLVEAGLETAELGAGFGIAVMIEHALDHAEPLVWIDGWERLDERQRTDARLVTMDVARSTALEVGAQFFITGVVQGRVDSTTVILRLADAAGDSLVADESVSGSRSEVALHQLGIDAVKGLLPSMIDPARSVDLSSLRERRADAIALWISGEREYRLSQFAGALEFYERAVAADSAFVLAAVKGAQAASWEKSLDKARLLVGVALADDSLLPQKYSLFARGLEAYLTGTADSAVIWLERALAASADWGEASMALAEVYYHLLPSEPFLDSLAKRQFLHALAADSGFSPPLFHLAEIVIREGDMPQAERLLAQFRSANPDPVLSARLEFMAHCVREGAGSVDWRVQARTNPALILAAAKSLSGGGAQTDCAEAGFRALLAAAPARFHWGAILGLQGVLAAQGRRSEVIALVDSVSSSGNLPQVIMAYVIDAMAGMDLEAQANGVAAFGRERWGDEYLGTRNSGTLWLFGSWHAHKGDVEVVASIHRELDRRARLTQNVKTRLFADAMAARLTLTTGDTTGAIEQLRALRPVDTLDPLEWGLGESLAAERMLLAELMLASGLAREAHDVATVFDHQGPVIFLPFIPRSLRLRRDAALAVGRGDLASVYENRLIDLGHADAVGGS
jgi:serine/threonine-protein kinase